MNKLVGFDSFSLLDMEKHWSGIVLFHFVEDEISSEARLVLNEGVNSSSLSSGFSKCFEGRVNSGVSEQSLVLERRLLVRFYETEIVVTVTPPRDWEEADFALLREVDSALRAMGVTPMAKNFKRRSFFQGRVVE